MGHLLASPLREVSGLAEAQSIAAAMFSADAVPAGAPVFFSAPFGPIAVFSDGETRQAEVLAGPAGISRVVAL